MTPWVKSLRESFLNVAHYHPCPDDDDNLIPSECPGAKLHNASLLVEGEVCHVYCTGRLQILVSIMIMIMIVIMIDHDCDCDDYKYEDHSQTGSMVSQRRTAANINIPIMIISVIYKHGH